MIVRIAIVCLLLVTGCYRSHAVDYNTCQEYCTVAAVCGGVDGSWCVEDCTASTWWDETSVGCAVAVDAWMRCVAMLGCDGVLQYEAGEPFSGGDYPCRREEEEATMLGCGGETMLPWR